MTISNNYLNGIKSKESVIRLNKKWFTIQI